MIRRVTVVRISVLLSASCLFMVEADCSYSEQWNGKAPVIVQPSDTFSKWEGRLVKRPGHSPEDDKIYFIEGGHKRWVRSLDWMWLHGYARQNVESITPQELAAIPLGEDIRY